MKKSTKLMALLAALCLVTSSFVGSTLAKYITDAEGSDTARVAKFGVTGTITGEAFATEYDLDTEDDLGFTLAVESSTEDKVVAPGTTGTFTGIDFEGTPEVAVNIETVPVVTLTNWEVDGAYYCPIVVTINGTEISGLTFDSADEFEAALEAALEAQDGNYAPNTNLAEIEGLNGDYTWEWAFEGDDEKDTALGDAAAANLEDAGKITLELTTTVTQID